MVRKVSFVVRPNPALGALLAFARASRGRSVGLGERLEREVRLALDGAARTLEAPVALLRWLARGGSAKATGYVDASGLSTEVTVTFDLRSAVVASLAQHPRVDGRACADLYALRSLLRALRRCELLSLDDVALGRQADSARSLLRVVEAACRETALADDACVPRAFARPVAPTATPLVDEAPKTEPKPRVKKAPEAAKSASFFGGLPDDATSAPPVVEVPRSERGLTLDGEFFLGVAAVTAWPCTPKVLARARKAVLMKLHPDRAGDGAEADFGRALRGYEDLVTVLAALPPPPPKVRPVAPTVTVAPATASSPIGQWPPPPSAVTEVVARQSFRRSSKA